ncbi:MAG: hypothetical protein CMQ41_07665 [Gammaproteobacteria bacterium]|nr:hypothetical protein [Gammaproteobacteria bacterium]|tara:strand:+ start:183 stop:854 length:672 start_codon:yes stop_codon:yes gene_type:complete
MHNDTKKNGNGNMNFKVASMLLKQTKVWLFPTLLNGSSMRKEADSAERKANGAFWVEVLKYQLEDGTWKDSSVGEGRHDLIKKLLKALRPFEGFSVATVERDGRKYLTEGELVQGIYFENEGSEGFFRNHTPLCKNFFEQLRQREGIDGKMVNVWRGDNHKLYIVTMSKVAQPVQETAEVVELPAAPDVVESTPAKKKVVRKKKATTRKKKTSVAKAAAKLKK